MTPEDVRRRVREIEEYGDVLMDSEAAHSKEDRLYADVLEAIANGAANAKELATEALKTADFDFCRWHA